MQEITKGDQKSFTPCQNGGNSTKCVLPPLWLCLVRYMGKIKLNIHYEVVHVLDLCYAL